MPLAPDKLDEIFDKHRKITYREEIERRRKMWKAADENNDGRLSVDEFTAYLRPKDFPHMREVALDRTMFEMDANGDGFVTKEEYIRKCYRGFRNHCPRL